jgi:hypothetical protein
MTRRWVAGGLFISIAITFFSAAPARAPAQSQEPTADVRAEPPQTEPEAKRVLDCIERNRPASTARQHVTFTCVDRLGQRRPTEAEILGKKLEDGKRAGKRAVRLHFTAPYDLRGSAFLINEGDGRNDMFFYSSATKMTRQVTGKATTGNLFCTDFSYEDFERWQLLNKPGASRRLPDSKLGEREVQVIETRPARETDSAYERIVTTVDRGTCVVLKTESFESGDALRKVLTADASTLRRSGSMWLATELEMQDLRDETHTEVSIADVEVDVEIRDREFQPSALPKL